MSVSLQDTIQGYMANVVRHDPRPHLLCPAGIGDLAWIACKMKPWALQHNAKFWLPCMGPDKQRRCGEYLELLGLDYGYLEQPEFKTSWVWDRHPDPFLPANRGWVSLHANGYVDNGQRIEKWYPNLPIEWPDTKVKGIKQKQDYVMMFVCTRWYMGGQRSPQEWAAIANHIKSTVAPVVFFGAHKDVEFLNEIRQHCDATAIINQSFKTVLKHMKSPQCKAVVGVASGPLIVNVYEGIAPTLLAYPLHLEKMPGSWENPKAKWGWCKLAEVWPRVQRGAVAKMVG